MYRGRTAPFAITLAVLMLTIVPVFTQFSPIHTVAATKPQPPPSSTSATWAKAYNIPYSYSVAESIAQTSSGGYVVGASCTAAAVTTPNCNTLSEPTATVMRVDSSGNIQSQIQYNYVKYPYSTPLNLIRPTADGGAIFAGNAQFGCPATGQTSCGTIVKVDSNGNVQWANDLQFATSSTYGPLTWPLDLQQTTDGGFVVAGYTFAPASSYNPFVVKLSSTGQIQWQHIFVDPSSQYSAAYAVRQMADGGYVVAGEVYYNQILVFKLDSTGTLVWQHVYAIGTDSYAETLALTSDGGFILGGLVSVSTATSYSSSVLLLKLDSTGNTQFVKTDSAGKVQWDKIYGADVEYSDRKFLSFQQTSDGGFIAAGFTNQYNDGYGSLWLVKTDPNGNISGCSDVKNGSDTSSTASVKVSNSDIGAVKDGISYLADTLAVFTGPLTATKEC